MSDSYLKAYNASNILQYGYLDSDFFNTMCNRLKGIVNLGTGYNNNTSSPEVDRLGYNVSTKYFLSECQWEF